MEYSDFLKEMRTCLLKVVADVGANPVKAEQ